MIGLPQLHCHPASKNSGTIPLLCHPVEFLELNSCFWEGYCTILFQQETKTVDLSCPFLQEGQSSGFWQQGGGVYTHLQSPSREQPNPWAGREACQEKNSQFSGMQQGIEKVKWEIQGGQGGGGDAAMKGLEKHGEGGGKGRW